MVLLVLIQVGLSTKIAPKSREAREMRKLKIVELLSMDWFKGKSTGNHGFYHQI